MWILLISILLFFFCYYKRTRTMSLLRRCRIPGPYPNLILGNILEMRNKSVVEYQEELIKRYGKVVGYYVGARPVILIADLQLIKNIQVNDFKIFTDRTIDFKFALHEKKFDGSLSQLNGELWKSTRKLMTPSFSSSRMKSMSPQTEESINSFLGMIGRIAEKGEEFDIYPMCERLTADIFLKTGFGIETNMQLNEENHIYQNIHEFASTPLNMPLIMFGNCFPLLLPLIVKFRKLKVFERLSVSRLYEDISDIIKSRSEDSSLRRNDILQALIDSTNDDIQHDQKSHRLTEDEVKANALLLYIGAFELSSAVIAFVAHNLTCYPEVQEKVRQEVKKVYGRDGKLDFNAISTDLRYLECVIKETLRLYSPLVSLITRRCSQEYKYENMIIPKGSTVMVSNHILHNDPDNWTNPETFDPDRFSTERNQEIKPFSFQAFGDGPRNCIGQRLAYWQMKLIFAKILLNFKLERGPNTEIGRLSTKLGLGSLSPKYGVFLRAVTIK